MVTIIPPAFQNSCTISDVYCNAEAFEAYVCGTLFPKGKFILIKRSGNGLHPVFTFHDLVTGFEFSTECIFRLGLIANSFHAAAGITDKKAAHFLVLGLGGQAGMPDQVFLINAGNCGCVILSKRHLRGKNINPNKAVLASQLWKKKVIPNYPEKKVA